MSTTVRDVVEDVVAQVAPEEAPLLSALRQIDDTDVPRMLRRRQGDEPLGFGLGELAGIVTPIVWLAVDEACRKALESAVDSAVESVRARVAKTLRMLFKRSASPRTVPALAAEQLAVVHRRVREDGVASGMPESAAEALADKVVARLLLAQSSDGSEIEA